MTYSTLLSKEGINSQFLVILKPRFKLSSFTFISGTKYQKTFSLGQIISIKSNLTTITEATSSVLTDGDWFYDIDTQIFYIDIGDDPNTFNIICTYEIYLGTFDSHWYRIPNDNTSREVYYEPLIIKSPSISLTVNDSLFGFMPSQSSSLIISNATHLLQEHIYSSSFANCDIDLWHWLGSLNVNNVNLIFKGLCGNLNYNDSDLTINVIDRNNIFKNEYRHAVGDSFYGSTSFPNCDPNYLNRPIRKIFGFVENMIPVNIDYVDSNLTTSDNRDWIVTNDENNLGSVSSLVPVSPVSTTTRTYLTNINGFNINDTVWIDSISGPAFDGFVKIIAVGTDYIEHIAIGTAAATGSEVKRNFVGNVNIFKGGILYEALYGRDYVEYNDPINRVAGFSFNTTLESNLSLPVNLANQDLIFCRVYGHKAASILNGNLFGSDSNLYGSLTNGIVILYDLLKTYLGLSENEIDLITFSNLESIILDEIGFVIPFSKSNDFPTYTDLIIKIAQTLLLKVFQNDNNKWTISQIKPLTTSTKNIQDDEIILNSFSYQLDYLDILSKVIVEYNKKEVSNRNEISSDSYSRCSTENQTALYLHLIKKQKTFQSFHINDNEAQILSDRLSFIFGDRNGTISFKTKNRFFNSLIGDEISISRTRMLGYEYNMDINRTRDLSIVSLQKSLNNINIELSDQKGIQDNEGNW